MAAVAAAAAALAMAMVRGGHLAFGFGHTRSIEADGGGDEEGVRYPTELVRSLALRLSVLVNGHRAERTEMPEMRQCHKKPTFLPFISYELMAGAWHDRRWLTDTHINLPSLPP